MSCLLGPVRFQAAIGSVGNPIDGRGIINKGTARDFAIVINIIGNAFPWCGSAVAIPPIRIDKELNGIRGGIAIKRVTASVSAIAKPNDSTVLESVAQHIVTIFVCTAWNVVIRLVVSRCTPCRYAMISVILVWGESVWCFW